MRPSSIAATPAESREAPLTPQHPSPLRGTLGSSLMSPAEGKGNEDFPPPLEKDFDSPAAKCLEALVPPMTPEQCLSPKQRGSLRFLPPLEMSPSSIATSPTESREAPPTPQYPSTLRDTLGSYLMFPAEVEGNDFFPPQPEKDLESPSSTRLEALVPSRDSRAMTRSPLPRAGRPDFPGAAREAP